MALTIKMRIDENPEHSYVFSTGDGGQIELIPLSVVQNGNYTPETGKAFNLVSVNVPETELETLNITENGTFTSESGQAWNVVNVNVEPLLEAMTKTITQNGTQTFEPSEGFDGISEITVVTNVPTPSPRLEAKSVSYDINGTYNVTPSTGYDGLSSVSVEVDVQGGGGVSNVDVGTFDTSLMTEGASNALFQFRANESPEAFYIYSDDPMIVGTPYSAGLVSFNGIANQSAGIPNDFYVGQSYFDPSMGDFKAYARDMGLDMVVPDGMSEEGVIAISNNAVNGWVTDMNNPTGFGLMGSYHYIVIYPTV